MSTVQFATVSQDDELVKSEEASEFDEAHEDIDQAMDMDVDADSKPSSSEQVSLWKR